MIGWDATCPIASPSIAAAGSRTTYSPPIATHGAHRRAPTIVMLTLHIQSSQDACSVHCHAMPSQQCTASSAPSVRTCRQSTVHVNSPSRLGYQRTIHSFNLPRTIVLGSPRTTNMEEVVIHTSPSPSRGIERRSIGCPSHSRAAFRRSFRCRKNAA
jgi:hypothetical protein